MDINTNSYISGGESFILPVHSFGGYQLRPRSCICTQVITRENYSLSSHVRRWRRRFTPSLCQTGQSKFFQCYIILANPRYVSTDLWFDYFLQWNTVKLELPHYLVKRLMTALVNELVKKNRYIPQLSIASSILERLNMLAPPPLPSAVLEITPASTDPPPPPVEKSVDKSQMFSESQRLATFYNWPHSDYKSVNII